MTNFEFLSKIPEYSIFSSAAIEAEKVYFTSPAMCAIGCRKALELAIKWVYSADKTIKMPYKDNLSSLIHETSFRFAVDSQTWGKLPSVVKLGNTSVHTEKIVDKSAALLSLESLFEFIQWVDYCYGESYEERHFDPALIPAEKVVIDTKKIKEQESLIEQKDSEIEALQKQIAEMSERLTAEKQSKQESRSFTPLDLSEFETRKRYIDVDLKFMGWTFEGNDSDVWQEYEVNDMGGVLGQKGYADYVLFGRDGLPLAVIEAKRTSKDPNNGRKQAVLYADCLERRFGRRPMMFTSNGFETYFWDDLSSPQRKVSGFFTKSDLEKLMNRRETRKKLTDIPINDKITDRYYQKEAIRDVCEHIEKGFRKALLVMATGTGKTRTASSLTDVLSRGGYITNILFLADRTALVKQAKDDFRNYLPDMSLCNLCSNKDDRNARIVFSTYPTILNSIDSTKTKDGIPLFSPAHFDLIITDESHRSIFKKYRAIFEYFDAIMVGLTATPKIDVDRNTYDFFEVENGVPTYAYDYETAVHTDHVLVPYYNYEVKLKFLEEGITYDDLSEEDKARYEDDFAEDGYVPDFVPSAQLNKFVFNKDTVDTVLQDLMERGIKVEGGDRLGKTIIFAQNKPHAEFIVERFNHLYSKLANGAFAQRITCDDSYAQTIIDDFKIPTKMPIIAVSVDMMDTGIDVPECVNLVFFKKVRSKTKFWQMIGRGTRLCKDLGCIDGIDGEYADKCRFLIFDYCGNFEYFREHTNGYENGETMSLTESIFCKQIRLIYNLQESAFSEKEYQDLRSSLVDVCCHGICELDYNIVSVRLKKEFVEKFKKTDSFSVLSEMDKHELTKHIAPLIVSNDTDELAKRFDNFMYGLMLANMEQLPRMSYMKKQLCRTAELIEKKATIPQVQQKIELIREIQTDDFWEEISIIALEKVRAELRTLMQFLDDGGRIHKIFTDISDSVIASKEGESLDPAYDFEDYRKKVNRYVEEHKDEPVIYKLNHNIPLCKEEFEELEKILTEELGGVEDYKREYGDTPFGLLIRKIAKLDHESTMTAFSELINDSSLNQQQIAFIHKIITHIENNGYIEDVRILMKPPFDKPYSFIKMFDQKTRSAIIQVIESIRNNAIVIKQI
ncbi:MAG: DEAD/DEAH box helicase family protein [Oscillospiraceae bacterium]|nr:DEAD/DEAH box helicase family protein [Oscillospiraceae bacterium]